MTYSAFDGSYTYSHCDITVEGDYLAVDMWRGNKHVRFVVEGFRDKTFLEVMNLHDAGGQAYGAWGRPFNDALGKVYDDLGLDFGYIETPLRPIREEG